MKKFTALLLALLMLTALVLASCGGSDATEAPTTAPTEAPTAAPTETPTAAPTEAPTAAPTETPTEAPTAAPTEKPTEKPTEAPTAAPTQKPTTNEQEFWNDTTPDGLEKIDPSDLQAFNPENSWMSIWSIYDESATCDTQNRWAPGRKHAEAFEMGPDGEPANSYFLYIMDDKYEISEIHVIIMGEAGGSGTYDILYMDDAGEFQVAKASNVSSGNSKIKKITFKEPFTTNVIKFEFTSLSWKFAVGVYEVAVYGK